MTEEADVECVCEVERERRVRSGSTVGANPYASGTKGSIESADIARRA